MTRKQVLSSIFLMAAGLLVRGSLQGFQGPVPVVDFATGLAGAGGTVSWTGGDAPLIGKDIRIGVVTGVDTPVSKPATPVGPSPPGWGVLSFTTGPHVDFNQITGVHTFRGNGNITITGSAPAANIQDPVALLSGAFLEATIGPNGRVNLGIAEGQGSSNPTLVSYFGLPSDVPSTFNMFLVTGGPGVSESDAGFVRNVVSTEVAAAPDKICRYQITAVPATCQVGTPPAVGTIVCARCPDQTAGTCPNLPGSSCEIRQQSSFRGTITLLCRVTLAQAAQNASCQTGPCPGGDLAAQIKVDSCR
jgi:hypothetical protein